MSTTKETIEKIIANNRRSFAVHQLWAMFDKLEREFWAKDKQAEDAFNHGMKVALATYKVDIANIKKVLAEKDAEIARLVDEHQTATNRMCAFHATNMVAMKARAETAEAALAAAKQDTERVINLLEVAKCPDSNCDGKGCSWDITMSPEGEPEQVQVQCLWCYEKSAAIDAARKAQP